MKSISKIQQETFKTFLSVENYKEVAKKSGYSLSTVCNIIAQSVGINDRNKKVIDELHKLAMKKMLKMGTLVNNYTNEYDKADADI